MARETGNAQRRKGNFLLSLSLQNHVFLTNQFIYTSQPYFAFFFNHYNILFITNFLTDCLWIYLTDLGMAMRQAKIEAILADRHFMKVF